MNLTRRWPLHLSTLALTVALGCDAPVGDPAHEVETTTEFISIAGGLAANDGAQRVGGLDDGPFSRAARIGTAETVALWSVRDPDVVLATAPIRLDGTFVIEGLPTTPGPFVVDARQGTLTVGRVLVPGARQDDAFVVAMPISTETSVEAEAYLALLDAGMAVDEIDVATVGERVTRQMATHVAHGEQLASAVWAAQSAFVARLVHRGVDIGHAGFAAARAGAYHTLAAQVAEGRWTVGWLRFRKSTSESLEIAGASLSVQAEAAQAAGFAFADAAPPAVAGAADALSACTLADFEARNQVAMADRIEGMHIVGARIATEFADYARQIDEARDRVDIATARRTLADQLVGAGSVLSAALASSSGRFGMADLDDALVGPRQALHTALADASGADDAIVAVDHFRAAVELALADVMEVEVEVAGLAVALITAAEVNLAGLVGS